MITLSGHDQWPGSCTARHRMMQQAINDHRMTMKKLTGILQSFPEDRFNQIPYEGSWTPGQIADHIVLFQQGIPELLAGEARPIQRPADALQKQLASVYLNHELKYTTPEATRPSNRPMAQGSIMIELDDITRSIIKAAQACDPAEECLEIEFPGLGLLTRLEWMYAVTYHTQRHIHQLQKIYLSLAA
ncbi:DinB family protein [Mucilaginibacter daejeonensis]|uniref:DinB family protein n=1 Tax=Mucilaginibacter daejeonensis TaxID=398049 RepID=UPI001D178D18|nr:DinB family protein [Mucilaginibacter daejeonensis]UEG53598.1 DinB family protein [Mucilaginibacter daejeonensis]